MLVKTLIGGRISAASSLASMPASCVVALLILACPWRASAWQFPPVETGGAISVMFPDVNRVNHQVRFEVAFGPRFAGGVREVKVTARQWPQAPTAAARHFVMEFEIQPSNRWQREFYHWRIPLEIADGTAQGEVVFWMPWLAENNDYAVEVYEDGARLRECSNKLTLPLPIIRGSHWNYGLGRTEYDFVSPHLLILDSDAPADDTAELALQSSQGRLPSSYGLHTFCGGDAAIFPAPARPSDYDHWENTRRFQLAQIRPLNQAPGSWLSMAGYDWVVVSLADLRAFAAHQRAKWEVLRQWLEMGGSLCVTDAPDAGARGEIERLLSGLDGVANTAVDWNWPDPSRLKSLQGAPTNSQVIECGQAPWCSEREYRARVPGGEPAFRWRAWGHGAIAAFPASDLFAGQCEAAFLLANHLGPARWLSARRFGGAPQTHINDFESLRIPGVGRPPLLTFLLAITLFAIIVGPLNYWLLAKWRRLEWMLITVPLVAILVAVGTSLFALLTEGFGARLKVVSVTALDQRRHKAAYFGRHVYYTGSSREGLRFPAGTMVIKLRDPLWNTVVRRHAMELEGDEQLLRRDFLPTREIVQYNIGRPLDSTASLKIATASDGSLQSVENQLGAEVKLLIARDEQGRLYWAQSIPPAGLAEASGATSLVPLDAAVQEPAAVSEFANRLSTAGLGNPNLGGSEFVNWQSLALPNGLIGRYLDWRACLEPRQYLAWMAADPHAPMGLRDAVLTDSVPLIHGTW